jgi:ATP adenylyltransferase
MENPLPDTLWAPWRLGYVQGQAADPAAAVQPRQWRRGSDPRCFLCRAAAAESTADRVLGVVDRTATSLVVVNRFPYSNGHLLLAPLDHLPSLGALSTGQLLELQELLVRWTAIIERTMQAQGFNVGLNLGAVAGAGLPGHLHWHLVPRWNGDVNFMATVAGTRVLPQALDSLWEQLTQAAGRR